jgi:hypothetical protein
MTQPAPYTPATIRRIRDLAKQKIIPSVIATDLGWDLERLSRVAREHSIDIAIAIPKPKTEGEA